MSGPGGYNNPLGRHSGQFTPPQGQMTGPSGGVGGIVGMSGSPGVMNASPVGMQSPSHMQTQQQQLLQQQQQMMQQQQLMQQQQQQQQQQQMPSTSSGIMTGMINAPIVGSGMNPFMHMQQQLGSQMPQVGQNQGSSQQQQHQQQQQQQQQQMHQQGLPSGPQPMGGGIGGGATGGAGAAGGGAAAGGAGAMKEINIVALSRLGQETVQDIVSRFQEIFAALKTIQPGNKPGENITEKKVQEHFRTIRLLFKRVRIIYEKCNDGYPQGVEYVPIESLIPYKDEPEHHRSELQNCEEYRKAWQENQELIEACKNKNRQIREIIDRTRLAIWEINTMLSMRRS